MTIYTELDNGRKKKTTPTGPTYVTLQMKFDGGDWRTDAGLVSFNDDKDAARVKALGAALAAGLEVRAIVDAADIRPIR